MNKKRNRKKSPTFDKKPSLGINKEKLSAARKVLIVKVFSPICKPLNGSLSGSNTSHLLKLWTFPYRYNNGKEYKESKATAYFIKGLRGAIRHQSMTQCKIRSLEVCHSSDKLSDKKGNKFLPEGFHLLGSCVENGECIIHSIYGSKNHRSKIRVSSLPIANISQKSFETDYSIQNVHISTENRVSIGFDGKAIQNFGDRYFGGEFEFEIDVTSCTPVEIGLLIESAMYLQKLGRGFNAGYAELITKSLTLINRITIRIPNLIDAKEFIIEEHVKEEPLPDEVTLSLEEWHNFLEKHTGITD